MKSILTIRGWVLLAFLFLYSPAFSQFSFIDGPAVNITEINFRTALTLDNSGGVWVGFNRSFGYYNGSSWTLYSTNTGAPFGRVSHIIPVNNNIWIASPDSGIAVLNNTTWTQYTSQNSGLINDTIRDMEVDGNSVWCATINGLSVFDGTTWTNFNTSNSALLSNSILQISVNNGQVWILSSAGVNMYHPATQSWAGWVLSSLPISGTPNSILSLGNDVWVGGFGGAAYLNMGSFHSIEELTDGENFNVVQIASGAQGMPIFINDPMLRSVVQLKRNAVPEKIINNAQSPSLAASRIAYNPITSTYYYTGLMSDMSTQPGIQVLAYGVSAPSINNWSDYSNNRYLNINDVNAAFLTRGDFGWNLSNPKFEVPKGGGVNSLFNSGFWIGGLDAGGQLHQGAMTYRQKGIDFFPGPLDTTNATTDSAVAYQYDYIWKINRTDIEAFIYHFAQGNVQNGTFVPAGDIITWPAHGTGNYSRNLAPFVDVNNNGIYDPLVGGDYPKIKGDQMLYWIFNDQLAPHTETSGLPLGIEVHASAWAFACPLLPDSEQVLNTTVFYSYEIINRSVNTYSDVFAGLYQDYDLGAFSDDFVGCSPADNTAFVYNGTPNDGGVPQPLSNTYGANPPVFGLTVLDGPAFEALDSIDNDNDGLVDELGEKNLLSRFFYFNNDATIQGSPNVAVDYYNYLRGYWLDNTPMTVGGNGYGGTTPTNFIYPGMPFDTTQWSETTAGNLPADRRGLSSTFIQVLQPQATATITYAQIWSRDTTAIHGTPNYINFFLEDVRRVQNWYATDSFPSCVNWTVSTGNTIEEQVNIRLYPNPGNELITLDYQPTTNKAQFELLDISGRIVASEQLQMQQLNVFNAGELNPGIYLVRISDGDISIVSRFIRN